MQPGSTRDAPSFWATVRAAIRGTEEDLTAIALRRAVILLAVPTLLEMSMESILTVVDIFVVARLGSSAVATVGLTEVMLSPVYALAMGLGAAATAMIARRTGEKDADGASVAAVQVTIMALATAALLGVTGALAAPRLLALLGAEADVVATGSAYVAVMLGGSVTIFLLYVVNAMFRSVGDAAVAMRTLWLANLVNIALAPCLVFGVGPFPRMGVLGAGVAMTASRALGVAYQAWILGARKSRLVVARRHLGLRVRLVRELAALATPATGQVLIESASWIALVRIVSIFGSAALAGYTIAMRVIVFALLPAWGLAQAAATLVGQNLGARTPDRARRSVWTIARYNAAFLGPVGLLFFATPATLVGFFSHDPLVAGYATECLRIVAVGFVAFSFGMVTIQAFNGAGDTTTPMMVNFASFWLFKIPCAYLLARALDLGPRGVFFAITAAYSTQALLATYLFRRGAWEKRRV